MKKNGFTLIELLIVTVIVVTLMGIVFRLAGIGSGQKARAQTIQRMQQLENALSGYYAAYGCYPPVPLQGRSRDIFMPVNPSNGVQYPGGSGATEGDLKDANKIGSQMARQIEAACRAQPVAVLFPPNEQKWEEAISELRAELQKSGDKTELQLLKNFGNQTFDKTDWKECELFQFGVLSFLLPRYSFMLDGNHQLYDRTGKNNRPVGQWADQNKLPTLLDGTRPKKWEELQDWLGMGEHWKKGNPSSGVTEKRSFVNLLASQAVCARWMPNFAKILIGGGTFFGVDTAYPDSGGFLLQGTTADGSHNFPALKVFSLGGGDGSGERYVLDGITLLDGWGNEFYYYSDPPYQSYRLWSSGPNGLTYPPWLELPSKGATEYPAVTECLEDDIVHASN